MQTAIQQLHNILQDGSTHLEPPVDDDDVSTDMRLVYAERQALMNRVQQLD